MRTLALTLDAMDTESSHVVAVQFKTAKTCETGRNRVVFLDVSVLACHNQLNSMPLISSWNKIA